MTSSATGNDRNRKPSIASVAVDRPPSTEVVHSHNPPWEDFSQWWGWCCLESLARQREVVEWWCDVAREGVDAEHWAGKAVLLTHQLWAAVFAATQNGVKLTLEQQRTLATLCGQAFRTPALFNAVQANTMAATWWPRAKGTALAWSMIPFSHQARVVKAWADFCSAPGDDD